MGEIEDLFAVGSLVGELFGGEVRVGDEGRAVELVVIVGERMGTGAGFRSNAAIQIVGVAGGVRRPGERAIHGGEVAVRVVNPIGEEGSGLGDSFDLAASVP